MIIMKREGFNNPEILQRQTVYTWEDGQKIVEAKMYVEDKDFYYFLDEALDNTDYIQNKVTVPVYESNTSAKLKFMSKFSLFDYQEVIKKFLLKRFKKLVPNRLLVSLAPGKGKTLVACNTLVKINRRFAIVVLAQYIDKWISDVKKNMNIIDDDIYVVQGKKSLAKLMEMKKKDIPKIVIFSNRTMLQTIKRMEEDTYDDEFKIPLYGLLEHCNMDTVLLDEVHQEFVSIYKIVMMFNPKRTLGLSATFSTDKGALKIHFENFFKSHNRINPLGKDKYRNVTSVQYKFSDTKAINYINWFTKAFGHVNLETSILKFPTITKRYLDMIEYMVLMKYIKRKPEDRGRCLIFVATIAMAEKVVERLDKKYPELDIRKYTGEDKMKNVLEPDICCSTLGSAGTAIDIDQLTTVIQTVSILSSNANIQSFGRLREIDGRDDLNFVYLWTDGIDSMLSHHRNRIKLFDGDYIKWYYESYPVDINPKIQREW